MSKPMSASIKTIRRGDWWTWRILGTLGELVLQSSVGAPTQTLAIQAAKVAFAQLPPQPYVLREIRKGPCGRPQRCAIPAGLVKGARIQKWGDLAWVMQQDTHIFVGDDLTPVTSIQQMTFLGVQRLLLQGDLYVANPTMNDQKTKETP